MGVHSGHRGLIGVVALGFALRLAFVLWAPAVPTNDGLFYHMYAARILSGAGYSNFDGSPAIKWMPGWPAFLAALYTLFGAEVRTALIANAVLGSATVGLVVALGRQLFDRRIALVAGAVYAIWPGVIYFAAVPMTETAFTLLIVLVLLLLAVGGAPRTTRRGIYFGPAGLVLGLAAMVKDEPLVLLPVMLGYLWLVQRPGHTWLRHASLFLAAAAIVVLPWTVRNYVTFGRFIPTSANGGLAFWHGNHPGGTGAADLRFLIAHRRRHASFDDAHTTLAASAAGWRHGWDFIRSNPGAWLGIVASKMHLTYGSDSAGVAIARGGATPLVRQGGRQRTDGFISYATYRGLAAVANAFWFVILGLAVLGVATVHRWTPQAAVLLLGPLAAWVAVHALMVAGPRYHFPETPLLALLAAWGVRLLARG